MAALLPPGAVVALFGELATGKTCLARGMASHFAAADAVHSPTFTLVNEYGDSKKMYHVDLYRVSSLAEVEDLGWADLIDSEHICAIEWAERAQPLLPTRRVDVTLEHRGGNWRAITIRNHEIMPRGWKRALSETGTQR